MRSVGETLRRARLEQGLDLYVVAAQTKINARYLEAIESDDRSLLPSGFFYKSFVDQYAKTLSLDTREIDAEIDRVLSADAPLPLPGFERVVSRNVSPIAFAAHRFQTRRLYTSAVSLVLVLAGCSGVYAWWHDAGSGINIHTVVQNVRAFVKPAPAKPRTVLASSTPPKPTTEKPAPQPVASTAPPQKPPEPKAEPVSLTTDTQPSESNETAIASPAAPNKPDYKVMLDLMAHEATWLSVSSDGKPVFSGVLQAHETKSVGGKQFARLRVGNAAGLEVRLNGKLLAPLGARGQVLNVLFTPDNFQIVAPPKESD
jgi:cytoskeletal protein RodZ